VSSFAALTLCVASQRVFIVVVCFVIDSVRKLLDTPSYVIVTRVNFVTYKSRSWGAVTLLSYHITVRRYNSEAHHVLSLHDRENLKP
jgi:hypothetical protein